ncbi:class I SAM-dependent methyltransferase [Planctomicrobium piriforme]|uniref:2-polyprenyl-6-hydroxyphenyl methylase / 3-demethylubiquinone-9 3-methyltransferase n=1 Tax=Planctomicrobium piriforme TaxID=1576369 RepID=A0A1I3F7C5_9PLAN|nr:class I SAM-dependent methyltransferase [Planctomicrobium piriforme]SFI07088.1 2-polyprenyl-6-hydroxyphenyl methylase / 3-demethylubiquinone-9 3-methyltransferase [Planctomicrobium piriforme]
MSNADQEIRSGRRYAFGKNWSSFLTTLDDARIEIAMQSLRDLLGVDTLEGRTFLDVGSGSGLFSLAARKLGADVTSFDYDNDSVACAIELRKRYETDPARWSIQQGSALDEPFLNSLGTFDVVYSWGVLHHTGDMWRALDLASNACRSGGLLAIALYNDQGWRSRGWRRVKQIYCSGAAGRAAMTLAFYPYFAARTALVSLVRRQNEFAAYRRHRGMSIVHDWRDWLGGLPFEVARFDDVVSFFACRDFELVRGTRTHRLGCHEFVFCKSPEAQRKSPTGDQSHPQG